MLMTELVSRLGRNDARLIGRDRFLIFMFAFAAYIAIALRYLLPWADGYLREQGVMPGDTIPIPLSDVFPMLVAYLGIYTGAMLVGTIFGFMLLDEREHNTLLAMLVTPRKKSKPTRMAASTARVTGTTSRSTVRLISTPNGGRFWGPSD